MTRKIILITLFLLLIKIPQLNAQKVSVSSGLYGSFMPSMGGNLDSYTQQYYFDSNSGIDGINRSMDGYSTSNIDRLTGVFAGLEVKAVFFEYYIVRAGANYGMGIMGGSGKTVFYSSTDDSYNSLKCEYSYKEYDFPFTVGLSIPFWKDFRISASCGTAFAYAKYENKFESDSVSAPFSPAQSTIKGSFSGWAFPLVVIIEGDYFIRPEVSLISAISYYKGASRVIKDSLESDGNVDFACIDFTGYRFSLGVSYYFYNK